jgi:hypothetical protein
MRQYRKFEGVKLFEEEKKNANADMNLQVYLRLELNEALEQRLGGAKDDVELY